ncbi:protein-disulfide reductase DsbD family protein [Parafilimonas sp.]|uniref:protein-disulfide reductase DsbD family protein n=1 Tax=Parafilimonas sp. TaxID=1969739 RepID=UPI0039E3AFB4
MQSRCIRSFFLFLILLPCCFQVHAQSNQPRFSFSTERKNDSLVYFKIKAKLGSGFLLFSAKPLNTDDTFISQLNLDSNAAKYLTDTSIIQSSNLQLINDKSTATTFRAFADTATIAYPLKIKKEDSVVVKGSFAWLGKSGDEFPSGEEKFDVAVAPEKASITGINITGKKPKSWVNFFWIGLLAGLIAVFTPCLYPLFPVTITYFMHHYGGKKQGRKNALFYSLCIILIYGIPTTLLTLIFGDTTLYKISIHPVTNLLFFAIFIVFALSFFGMFEITLPSSWSTQTDKLAGKKGYIGIFFMALTLVIVSFSCTGIVAGQLLSYLSSEGISIGPIAGMFGFGFGLALPFTVLAMFPSLVHSMPKSGGWLNTVKVSFAFIELAMALKFLSNVDLIYNWRLLDREIFIAIWMVLSVLLGLYLLGKLKFYHDSEVKHINITRLFFAIAAFTFALYLLPGMWGAPLKFLSGWIPPEYTLDFNLSKAHGSANGDDAAKSAALPPKKFADKISAPHGLTAYFDLNEGIAAAKALHKPIMLDFTGYSCSNCRRMEAQVWSDPEVLKRIRENFVLVSLYVDEPTELAADERYKNARGEEVENVGDKNLDYEITKFGSNAQPLYMFITADQKILSDIKYGYDADIDKFIKHLDAATAAFDSNEPAQ